MTVASTESEPIHMFLSVDSELQIRRVIEDNLKITFHISP